MSTEPSSFFQKLRPIVVITVTSSIDNGTGPVASTMTSMRPGSERRLPTKRRPSLVPTSNCPVDVTVAILSHSI